MTTRKELVEKELNVQDFRFVSVGKQDGCEFYVRLIVDSHSVPLGAEVKRVESIGRLVLGREKWLLSIPELKRKH